jgi:FixJ family two-component response regulator
VPGPLRVLIVEDVAADAALVERRLTRAGFDLSSHRVEDEAGLREAIANGEWDIVLADYNLPGFSGLEAMRIIAGQDIDLPLVLVSGVIDVPTALDAMKAGAKDFVLKDDLERLPSVVERELADAAQRRDGRRAEKERDRALKELRESNERLSAFAALTDFPLQGLTTRELAEALVTRIADALDADGASLLLLDGDTLRTAGSVGPNAGHTSEISLGTGFSGSIASQDMPVYVRDVRTDARVTSPVLRATGIRSMLGVPMHLGEAITGVLHIEWCATYDPPSWMLPLLEIAADRCAMAIENARLYEREHGIAETLQRALLSVQGEHAGVEVGQFYASATEQTLVGGDFYDLFEVSPGRIAFSIGDVSGKGVDAATVTALVKNTLRAHTIDGDEPAETMMKTNNVMGRFTTPETFVTALFGVLDVASGDLTYCSAGHLPPMILAADGIRELESRGLVLGVVKGVKYEQATTRLGPRESLVMYTDGLSEARTPAGEFYGEARLKAFLEPLASERPTDVARRIAEELDDFSGGRMRDDTAVLVLRLTRETRSAG